MTRSRTVVALVILTLLMLNSGVAITTGAIVQNVYLYAASEGLATVVRGWIDKPVLAQAMGLRAEQYIIVAQSVGYPGE